MARADSAEIFDQERSGKEEVLEKTTVRLSRSPYHLRRNVPALEQMKGKL